MIILSLKLLYRKNKYIFFILIIMQIFIASSMLYIISKINGRMYRINDYNDGITTFIVDAENCYSDEVEKYINNLKTDEIDTVSIIIGTDYNCSSYVFNEKNIIEKNYKYFGLNSIDYYSWSTNSNIMLSIKNMYSNKSIPKTVKIYDEEYYVTGAADEYAAKYSIILYNIIKTRHIPILKIRIKYNSINGISDMKNKYADIIGAFPGHNITEPVERNFTKEEIFRNDNVIQVILAILSIISEMYLYIFLVKSTIREFAVYELCGAKKRSIVLINFFVLSLIFILCYLFGTLLYKFVFIKIIAKAEPIIMSVSSLNCYILAFLMLFISIMCIFIPIIIFISKFQIVSVIKETKTE